MCQAASVGLLSVAASRKCPHPTHPGQAQGTTRRVKDSQLPTPVAGKPRTHHDTMCKSSKQSLSSEVVTGLNTSSSAAALLGGMVQARGPVFFGE